MGERRCPICDLAPTERDPIDAALVAGRSLRVVEAEVGAGWKKSTLGVHRGCLVGAGRICASASADTAADSPADSGREAPATPPARVSDPASAAAPSDGGEPPVQSEEHNDVVEIGPTVAERSRGPDARRKAPADTPTDVRGQGRGVSAAAAVAAAKLARMDARARVLFLLDGAKTYEERCQLVADLLSRGDWDATRIGEYARRWNVTRTTVIGYQRTATIIARTALGDIEQRTVASIGELERTLELVGERVGELDVLVDHAVQSGDVAAEGLRRRALNDCEKLGQQLREHRDRISGVLVNQAPNLTVNVLRSPEIVGVMRIQAGILDELFPGASAVVAEGVEAWTKGGVPALEAWIEERKRDARAIEA